MRKALILLNLILVALTISQTSGATTPPKKKYPGGKCYIYRYTLENKGESSYTLDRPQRWLSHKSIERRKKQGLALDSTDLPVSTGYLKAIERIAGEANRATRKLTVPTQIIGTSRWNNTVLVRSADTILLKQIGQQAFVKHYENVWTAPDSIERKIKVKPNFEFNPWDSVHGSAYGHGREQIEMLNGHRLHGIGYRGKGITIAILDGGFMNVDQIPAFQRTNIEGVKDFVYPNSPLFYQETDHGTKVLSTMAANEPEVFIGTAPDARYWLLRCEDQQTEQPVEEDYWAMAAEFADSLGADIITSSLGYTEYDDRPGYYRQSDLDGRTALISRTASMLAQKGIILVNSAGNSGMGPWKKITFPADADNTITVGALNPQRVNAPFSGVGPTQDMRVKPDVMALGSPASLISGRGGVIRDMGTSFSTPIVAGLVACLWQSLPDKTALEIINLIRQNSNSHQRPDNVYGYGIPNFWRAYMVGKMEKTEELKD